MTQAEWKSKTLALIKAYLEKNIGYPNCDPRAVLMCLPQLWNLLGERGLQPEGATYQMFESAAHHKYMKYEMQRMGIVF